MSSQHPRIRLPYLEAKYASAARCGAVEFEETETPTATELAIDTSANALTLVTTIFGNGVAIDTATLTGVGAASATYSGANATLGGIAPADTGIILSTGNAAELTISDGSTNTITGESGVSTNHSEADDAALGAATGHCGPHHDQHHKSH